MGTDRSVLLTTGLLRPQGLTIDYDENRLYWVDDETATVEMADLDGGQRSSFSAKEPGRIDHKLFGIAVYKVRAKRFLSVIIISYFCNDLSS